jgi:hypothetical protein
MDITHVTDFKANVAGKNTNVGSFKTNVIFFISHEIKKNTKVVFLLFYRMPDNCFIRAPETNGGVSFSFRTGTKRKAVYFSVCHIILRLHASGFFSGGGDNIPIIIFPQPYFRKAGGCKIVLICAVIKHFRCLFVFLTVLSQKYMILFKPQIFFRFFLLCAVLPSGHCDADAIPESAFRRHCHCGKTTLLFSSAKRENADSYHLSADPSSNAVKQSSVPAWITSLRSQGRRMLLSSSSDVIA